MNSCNKVKVVVFVLCHCYSLFFSGYTLSEVSKYIKSLPCSVLKLVKSGSDIISEGVVNALENEAKRTVVSILYS